MLVSFLNQKAVMHLITTEKNLGFAIPITDALKRAFQVTMLLKIYNVFLQNATGFCISICKLYICRLKFDDYK